MRAQLARVDAVLKRSSLPRCPSPTCTTSPRRLVRTGGRRGRIPSRSTYCSSPHGADCGPVTRRRPGGAGSSSRWSPPSARTSPLPGSSTWTRSRPGSASSSRAGPRSPSSAERSSPTRHRHRTRTPRASRTRWTRPNSFRRSPRNRCPNRPPLRPSCPSRPPWSSTPERSPRNTGRGPERPSTPRPSAPDSASPHPWPTPSPLSSERRSA